MESWREVVLALGITVLLLWMSWMLLQPKKYGYGSISETVKAVPQSIEPQAYPGLAVIGLQTYIEQRRIRNPRP